MKSDRLDNGRQFFDYCDSRNLLFDSVVEDRLQTFKNLFDVSSETNDLISNKTIEEAGPIFVWMLACPTLYWIAWNEFYNDLFKNHSLREGIKDWIIQFCAEDVSKEGLIDKTSCSMLYIPN